MRMMCMMYTMCKTCMICRCSDPSPHRDAVSERVAHQRRQRRLGPLPHRRKAEPYLQGIRSRGNVL